MGKNVDTQRRQIINNASIPGCTDPAANNYNPSATFNNGTCVYGDFNTGGLDRPDRLTDAVRKSEEEMLEKAKEIEKKEEVQTRTEPKFTPDIKQAICVTETKYDTNWPWEQTGYQVYLKEVITQYNTDKINGFGNGNLSLGNALGILIEQDPNSRIFINSVDLSPWVVPFFYGDNLTSNKPNISKLAETCQTAGGTLFQYTPREVNQSSWFAACLCEKQIELTGCQVLSLDGDVSEIGPKTSTCITSIKEYFNFLELNYDNLSPDVEPFSRTSFFNEYVLQQLGLSEQESFLVFNNINNRSDNTLRRQALILLENAFTNGGNLYLELGVGTSTNIVRSEGCCVKKLGGVWKEGKYLTSDGNTELGQACLCNEPVVVVDEETNEVVTCPNFENNFIDLGLDSDTGETIINDITEECCNNQSLKSKFDGNWTWDGEKCVLKVSQGSNINTETTKIVVNENPIVSDLCSEVEISFYMYFTEPNNSCVDGVLSEVTPTPTVTQEQLDRLSSSNIDVVKEVSKETFTAEYEGTKVPKSLNDNGGKCCYDTSTPIIGQIFLEDGNDGKVIELIDTYSSTDGFSKWVKMSARVTNLDSTPFNFGVEFTQGLFKCCDYDIYFDDIKIDCQTTRTETTYSDIKRPGFTVEKVIDNKKSWVYNPGDELISDATYDVVTREGGTTGLLQGHGNINRTFAPSLDAELDYRDTDYFQFGGSVEKHSDLVLNSKEVVLQFNMCAEDKDCQSITGSTFPNLVELENFKKTFQGFWTQFMEQFIPSTTIFVSGEKWCNAVVEEEKTTDDYILDSSVEEGGISPLPTTDNVKEQATEQRTDIKEIVEATKEQTGEKGDTTSVAKTDTTFGDTSVSTKVIGDIKLQYLERDLYETKRVRQLAQTAYSRA